MSVDAILKPVYSDEDDETTSPDWERIKTWLGSQQPQKKHPIQQMAERDRQKVQHFDEGGDVQPDWMQGAADKMAAPAAPPVGIIPPPGQINPTAGLPPAAAPMAPPAPASPAAPAPLATTPQVPPANYDAEAAKIMGGITPETLAALEQKVMKPSGGQLAGMGLAGIGDAIASIGERKPEALKTATGEIAARREAGLKLPEQMAAVGKERFGLSQMLQTQDPNSPYSKVIQNAERPTLQKLGWTDEQINKAPAVAIEDAAKNSLTYEDTQAKYGLEKAIHEETIGLQEAQLKNTESYQKAQQDLARQQHEQEAAKALEGRGMFKRASDYLTGNPATKTLERQAGAVPSFAPDVMAYSAKHGITPEQAQSIKDRRTGGQ